MFTVHKNKSLVWTRMKSAELQALRTAGVTSAPVGNSQTCWNHTLAPRQDSLSSPSQGHSVRSKGLGGGSSAVSLKNKGFVISGFLSPRVLAGFRGLCLSRLSISPWGQQVVNEWNGLGSASGQSEKIGPLWQCQCHSALADGGNSSLVESDLSIFQG